MATLSNSTSVRLPNDVMGILKSQAKEEHRSVSNYIRMILTEFVKHKRQEPNATTRAAIEEARSDMDLEELDVDHFKDFVASL
ncbi:toxin-antitoxin system protein [Hallella absiana]|jgi:hypothetical protein|uniref:toxin-antitoxin system protein n=1 Tax=Hallella absiana TaxID=2925336 RepID=UPI0021CA72F7|nr:toxin-antitoxin system protein [Hallella absiana]